MKKAVMYGAGNIGRGFIGQLFSQSGYEVAFIDINRELIDTLNREHRYPIRILNGNETRDIWVENVSGIDGTDVERVAEAVAKADIMATAVGAGALPTIAKNIAEGLKKRWQSNMIALDILVCENLPEGSITFAGLVRHELGQEFEAMFDQKVGMVETSIGRMVPLMTPEMKDGNNLRVCVEEFCALPVDQDGFKGAIPSIINMAPTSPFAYIHQRKLYIHNMGHAITAYFGRLKEYKYIADAIENPVIRQVVTSAMRDLAICLCKRHGTSQEDVNAYIDDLIRRFGNQQLCDTVDRVGNDVRRKLSPRDRLVGAARLCVEYCISPIHICLGIAAAIHFLLFDSKVDECLKYTAEEILGKICEIDRNDPLYSNIMPLYKALESNCSLEDTVNMATEMLQGSDRNP